MGCLHCPAAFLIVGADRQHEAVLCRVDSTTRGQHNANAGPIALVRATESTASFHGYCMGDLGEAVARDDELGALATPVQRDIADRARNSGARLVYADCPSWQAERDNRAALRLAEQPGRRRVHAT